MNGVKTGLAVRGRRVLEGGRAGPVWGRQGRRGLEGGRRAGPPGGRILVTIPDDGLARPRSGAHRLRRQVRVDAVDAARPSGTAAAAAAAEGSLVLTQLIHGPGARAVTAGWRCGRRRR